MDQTIGEQLRNARVEKKLTLDNAAQALHIRVKYLEALESGHPELIPSRVQGKGFLRMYAAYLGLPIPPLLDLWEGRQPSQPEVEVLPSATKMVDNTSAPEEETIATTEAKPQNESPIPQPLAQQAQSQSDQSFLEIGKILAERRLLLNLSLEEVENFIHVRQHYLKALEDGQINDLPSPVQGRGMLNNYAHFLNLDAEGLLTQFAEGLQNQRMEKLPSATRSLSNKATPRKTSSTNRWTRFLTPDLIIVGSVILGLIIFAIWSATEVTTRQREYLQATPPSISEVLLSASPQKPAQSGTPSLAPNIGTRQPQQTSGSTRAAGATLAITGTVPITGSGQVQIYVVTTQRSYLRITADNRIIFDERLVPGNAYAFAGNQRLEVLISNAAGIKLFYNQQDLGNLGVVGEVKSLVFTREEIITPTIAFTATPSRTPIPSATQRTSPTGATATITPFIP